MEEVVKTITNVKIVNNNVSDLKIKIQMLNEIIEKKDIKLFLDYMIKYVNNLILYMMK